MVTTTSVRVAMIMFPVMCMIALVPLIGNDFLLAAVYIGIIAVSSLRFRRHDFIFLVVSGIVLFISEFIFVSTGVETFERQSLLGVMPVWLPLLWAYAFVAIKHAVAAFKRYLP